MSDIPHSQTYEPQPEPTEPPPAYPLGADFTALASHMAATIAQGLMAATPIEWTAEEAARVAVELTMNIANEVRAYRLVNNRAVKPDA